MRAVAAAILLVCAMLLVACGKKPNGIGAQPAVTVTLSSAALPITLTPGVAATVTATVYDQGNQGVVWTITPLNFGTLTNQTSTNQSANFQTISNITYTAPLNVPAPTTLTLTATSVSNPNVTASLPVKVTPIVVDIVNGLSETLAVDQTMNPGDQISLVANATPVLGVSAGVNWTISPATGAGTLTVQDVFNASYVAPSSASSPITAIITATSITDPDATASLKVTILPSGAGPNVTAVSVDGGPVPNQIYPNAAFTSVTICAPGSLGACQTVDGVLVDTGSYGLRVLQSKVSQIKLPTYVDANGNTLENCASNVDGSYMWGPVSQADVHIAGETTTFTSPLNIQVISSTAAVVPSSCTNGGTTALITPQLLGANGILGIGPEPTDCTVAGVNLCDGSTQPTPPNLYYACFSTGCSTTDSPVIVSAVQQITNPVTFLTNTVSFSNDNNGTILQLPSVSGTASSVIGTLIFGINTQPNNQIGSATVFTMDSNDNFTTIYNSQTLTNSFIDSGSNALYFPDTLPACSDNSYYCPPSLTTLSAENQGATQGDNTVSFSVDDADSLLSNNPGSTAFSSLAGPKGTYQSCSDGNISCVFDWGLPFFYGRSVYTAIDGKTVSGAPASPWWAY